MVALEHFTFKIVSSGAAGLAHLQTFAYRGSGEDGYTREKEERTSENKMERRMPTRLEKYWTESLRGDGQGDVN